MNPAPSPYVDAAAATSPRNSPRSFSSSGCHCTASQKGRSAISIASTLPSAARAATSYPGAVATAWWWAAQHLQLLPDQTLHHRPRRRADVDGAESVVGRGVVGVADEVGNVLLQRPATVDGHQLHASTHPQRRQQTLLGGVEQSQLPGVAVVAPAEALRVRGGPVPLGVDVAPTADDQAVEATQDGAGRSSGADRRQQHRYAAAGFDGAGVVRRKDVGGDAPDAPDAPATLLAVGGDADHRSGGAHRRELTGG